MYLLPDGTETSVAEITAAFEAGQARLLHGRADGHNPIIGVTLDGEDIDTRGECYSMWDERWTSEPQSLGQCLKAAQL